MAQEPKQSKRLTMVELAKEAGVSTTTVSKVLNQLPGVGAQTRARIQQLFEQNASIKRASLLLSSYKRTFQRMPDFYLEISMCCFPGSGPVRGGAQDSLTTSEVESST